MDRLELRTGSAGHKAKGCRWLDAAYLDVFEIERIWKNSIRLRSLRHGTTAQFSKHAGMTAANGWRPLSGCEFKRTFGTYGVDWEIETLAGAGNARDVALRGKR